MSGGKVTSYVEARLRRVRATEGVIERLEREILELRRRIERLEAETPRSDG